MTQPTPTLARTDHANVGNVEGYGNMKTKWRCERCGVTVTLYVNPSQPPTHPCSKKLKQTLPLNRVEPTKGEPRE